MFRFKRVNRRSFIDALSMCKTRFCDYQSKKARFHINHEFQHKNRFQAQKKVSQFCTKRSISKQKCDIFCKRRFQKFTKLNLMNFSF